MPRNREWTWLWCFTCMVWRCVLPGTVHCQICQHELGAELPEGYYE